MKIGLVRRGYSRTGGAEAYLRRFADAAVAAGHTIVLFSERWPQEEWPFELVPLASTSPRSFADAMVVLRPRDHCDFLFSLERIRTCDAYRAGDGVHAAWLERRARFEPAWKGWFRRFNGKHREILALEKELFGPRGARGVVANSALVREEIVQHFQYPEAKIRVVHNGVPPFDVAPDARAQTRVSLGLKEDDYAILFAGSGWSRKGLRFAIEAVNLAKVDRAVLLIAGRGNPHTLPKCGQARFLGPVKDMPPLLAAADAFILPTIYDPFSNACLEALAAGLPVITTAQNGFSEIIESGVEGEIVDQPNDIPALASAIKAWSDPDRRAVAKLRLEILSTQYTIAENVRQTLAAIQALR
ncbi:MAG: glycosyltransferase family 4 protein [Chthoniobacter sp.]|uniref:glycosyltransferase family 4 protein n=1 Tax=Chthoniobacter sp. TaxID=2510640 RepID=UPI0032A1CC49